ncbi:hypothetical protein ACNHYB_06400 [Isoptericola jiangsuensis]|uniref:hypothetical protein n=1 Tax=Isoptericola jiangsuensis TaxID=548579 RepID=UPI003AACC8FF
MARDLLGLRRRAGAVLGSVVCGVLGVALLAASAGAGATLAVVAGALLLYAASGTWAAGLRAMAEQPVPGGLLPGRLGRQVTAHLVVPGVLALVSGVLGLGTAVLLGGGPGWRTVVLVVGVVAVALGARVWVAGASTVPIALFTPVPGPTGDLSMVSVAAWYLRGWLLVGAAAWAVARFGPVVGVVCVGLARLLVRAAVRRAERE